MKTYPTYKDSGVDWLGKIPKDWKTKRSKFLWTEITNLSEEGNEQLLSVSQYDGVKTNENESRSENLIGYKKVSKDNLVTNIMLAWLGGLGISNFNGVVSPAYSIYKASNEISPRFTHYLYRTKIYLDEFARRSSGVVPSRWRMYTDDFGEVRTILPPKPEQQAIANFLDETCRKLDTVVAQKEKMIALLKERKQALIQKAVTRGLNENVPMKDSGVDWIGDIPENWEVKALKFICNLKSGEFISSEDFKEDGYPVYGGNGFRAYSETYTNQGFYALIGRQGALCGNVNYARGKFYATEHAVVVYPINGEDTLWLGETIKTANFNRLSQSAAQPGIAVGIIKNERFPYPPLPEQKKIADYIEAQSQKIDQAVRQQEQTIVKLKEYKASLIDSCVLGKIKVS